jgi:hypothetical protein
LSTVDTARRSPPVSASGMATIRIRGPLLIAP